jgi:hypothetical protein
MRIMNLTYLSTPHTVMLPSGKISRMSMMPTLGALFVGFVSIVGLTPLAIPQVHPPAAILF